MRQYTPGTRPWSSDGLAAAGRGHPRTRAPCACPAASPAPAPRGDLQRGGDGCAGERAVVQPGP
ncbi:MAG TPA: hypothetical protein ENK48_06770 [Gammaproteobacteria bacterium]|nr:hypothetical protein [Gammaproteobacteria bacterium]